MERENFFFEFGSGVQPSIVEREVQLSDDMTLEPDCLVQSYDFR